MNESEKDVMENIFQIEKNSGIDNISEKIRKWIFTLEFTILLQSFGKTKIQGDSLKSQIEDLVKFSSLWDFRGKQKKDVTGNSENARWTIANSDFSEQQEENIMRAAAQLGLIGCTMPSKKNYDYIFVLGGARMSCLFRMRYAKQICDMYNVRTKSIIGLAGMRGIMDSERNATDTYALEAKTEFDLMRASLFDVFGNPEMRSKEEYINRNSNASWEIEVYHVDDATITLLGAPSGEPDKRRANTSDTFDFFMKQFQVNDRRNILMITSQIYVPYQQLEAVRIMGIPYKHSLETIGFPNEWSASLQGLQKPENYLQEIRSVLQSADRLLKNM